MNGKLSRISKSDKSGQTRSEMTSGMFIEPPTPGKAFSMISGTKFDGGEGNRFWQTSEVIMVYEKSDKVVRFGTKSGSVYQLDIE